jgi:hypothetical protein
VCVYIYQSSNILIIKLLVTPKQWLSIPQQKLLAVTSGKIFVDNLNLEHTRNTLSYYPRDIHLYMCKAQWIKMSQESAFVGRSGICGDEIGSQIIASQIVHEAMRLCFLLERKYYPYSKWFGTAFSKLNCAKHVTPLIQQVLSVSPISDWKERELRLAKLYITLGQMHNEMVQTFYPSNNITPIDANAIAAQFHDRPFISLHEASIIEQLDSIAQSTLTEELQNRNNNLIIGSVNQFCNQVEVLENPSIYSRIGDILYNLE